MEYTGYNRGRNAREKQVIEITDGKIVKAWGGKRRESIGRMLRPVLGEISCATA